jgi:hypothetical protein
VPPAALAIVARPSLPNNKIQPKKTERETKSAKEKTYNDMNSEIRYNFPRIACNMIAQSEIIGA